MPRQSFVISAARGRAYLLQPLSLFLRERLFALRQYEIPQPVHVPSRPSIARAMNDSECIRLPGIDQCRAQDFARIGLKIYRCLMCQLLAGRWVSQCYFCRVQTDPVER